MLIQLTKSPARFVLHFGIRNGCPTPFPLPAIYAFCSFVRACTSIGTPAKKRQTQLNGEKN